MTGPKAAGAGQGVRGRRKSSRVAGAVTLLVVGAALAAASVAIGSRPLLWAALACGVAAAFLIAAGRVARKSAPPHAEHPHPDHPEDHP